MFCGFKYDVQGIPTIWVPSNKKDNAESLIHFLEKGEACGRLSHLMLAIEVRKLQSMVPATACNMGASFLHQLYGVLYEKEEGSPLLPSDVSYYYCKAHMMVGAWEEFGWWHEYFDWPKGGLVQARDLAVLASDYVG